jgi:hypothetical protein
MKCAQCGSEAVAICKFCGRAVCKEHVRTKTYASGYGQKIKDNLWPSGSPTGLIISDAAWCGQCNVDYQKTY